MNQGSIVSSMGKRKRIGLFFSYNENWIGGTYYIQNLILALGRLPDEKKPELIVLTTDEKLFTDLARLTNYPYLSFRSSVPKFSLLQRAVNRAWRNIFQRNCWRVYYKDIDLFFPASMEAYLNVGTRIYWIPDFQEHYLAEFFTPAEVAGRKNYQQEVVNKGRYIVFSSQATREDFNEIYPRNDLRQYILPFAVSNDVFYNEEISDVLAKYQLPAGYFICSNQFWKHKNHRVILKAVAFLKGKGIPVHIVFTGKEHDYRNPGYFEEIQSLAESLHIKDSLSFLGFISREDQLALLKHSLAVVQPSLFEGWSTVIEDAKAANVKVIASDTRVHREQLDAYPCRSYFSAHDHEGLGNCLMESRELPVAKAHKYDYDKNVIRFAETFIAITDDVVSDSLKNHQTFL